MPTYEYACLECGAHYTERRDVEDRDSPCRDSFCPDCFSSEARRVFTPTAAIQVPESFKRLRGWHLPPKGHPAWEKMQKEGTGRVKTPDRPTLEDEFEKAGLLG